MEVTKSAGQLPRSYLKQSPRCGDDGLADTISRGSAQPPASWTRCGRIDASGCWA